MARIEVDHERCTGCGLCKALCPKGPRVWEMEEGKAIVKDSTYCIMCGMCATRCPAGAIKYGWYGGASDGEGIVLRDK